MNIIITEEQEQKLMNLILSDDSPIEDLSDKRLSIKKYLDRFYKKGSIPQVKDGEPATLDVVVLSDNNGKLLKTLSDKQLFDQIQAKFKNILPEKDRDSFIKDCIIAWYNGKIKDSGTLSI